MLAQTSPQMDKAVTVVRRLSADEQVRRDYEQAEKRRRDLMVITNTAIREGLAKGEAIGIAKGEVMGIAKGEAMGIAKGETIGEAKGRTYAALNLLRMGVDKNTIAQATGLSHEEIQKLEN